MVLSFIAFHHKPFFGRMRIRQNCVSPLNTRLYLRCTAARQQIQGALRTETITFDNIYANLRAPITQEVVMKKGELIAEFAKRTELSAAAANGAVNTLIAIITERLKKGDTVGITGFGTFSVAKRAARKGRNPATGEAIKIAASKTPKFSAGATLKSAVNPTKKK
ncbi:HU family DNA-binding protein [Duganella sp. BuS-21]